MYRMWAILMYNGLALVDYQNLDPLSLASYIHYIYVRIIISNLYQLTKLSVSHKYSQYSC